MPRYLSQGLKIGGWQMSAHIVDDDSFDGTVRRRLAVTVGQPGRPCPTCLYSYFTTVELDAWKNLCCVIADVLLCVSLPTETLTPLSTFWAETAKEGYLTSFEGPHL